MPRCRVFTSQGWYLGHIVSGEDALATPLQLASDLHKPSEGLFPGVAVGRLRGTLLVDWTGKGPPLLCNGGTTAH